MDLCRVVFAFVYIAVAYICWILLKYYQVSQALLSSTQANFLLFVIMTLPTNDCFGGV